MMWSVKGRVSDVLPLKKITTNTGDYSIQEYVIDVEDDYQFKFAFKVRGDDKIRHYNIKHGDCIEVNFNVVSQKWKDKWITSVWAWRVRNFGNESYQKEKTEQHPNPQNETRQPKPKEKKETIEKTIDVNDVNNLPF